MKRVFFCILAFTVALSVACRKESFITSSDASVVLSADTLRFDTVFTSVGSVTQVFTITNDNAQKLKIDRVHLGGGANSVYRINVNGYTGPDVKDLEMDAHDSIFVFVTVRINPNLSGQPFIVQDSIGIEANGNSHWVQLEAWGQNAHFLRSTKITGNTVWNNDLPYVILGGLQIDTGAKLSINQGCRVYFHANAPMLVDGSLAVNGDKFDSTRVNFSGDRLDDPYNGYPAAWPGIYFRGTSNNNVLLYAVIRNAYQGLIAQYPSINANPKLTLNNCILDNIYDVGLYGIQSSINAVNCLVSNCGKNIQLVYGGNYQFLHCTVPAIGNSYIAHENPALYISNYIKSGNNTYTDNLQASFTNCIFWGENGTVDNEVVTAKQGGATFSASFTNCLWKVKTNPADATANNIIANQNPAFDTVNASRRIFNFRLKASSPAVNAGISTATTGDLDGNPRPVGLPDMGAYENQ